MTNKNNKNNSAAIQTAANTLQATSSLLNALALTTAGPHADAALFLAQCVADAVRSYDAAEYATPAEADTFDCLLQLDADIRAVDEARAELEATVANSQDLVFVASFRAFAFEGAMTALQTASAATVADCYAGAFVPARDAYLDAVLKLAEKTIANADNIVENLLNNR